MFEAYAADAAGHAASHGHFYMQPEFYVAMAFVAVVGFAFKPVGRAIGAALDMRAEKIKHRLDEVERLRNEAQEMLAKYQRKQSEAMKEAEEILAHAKAEAKRLAEQAEKDLANSLKRREQQALDRIAQAEAQAIAEVRGLAIDLAMAATRQLIADGMTAAKTSDLADQAIAELGKKFN
jgi:F-type H+-transporting ATPase subunit b